MITAEANLRLGLAGGGTDVSPYPETFGGRVVNFTIDRPVITRIGEFSDGVLFRSIDQNSAQVSSSTPYSTQQLPLHQAVHDYFYEKSGQSEALSNLLVETKVDTPIGSGLGTSSTLVVSLAKAYAKLLGLELQSKELAEIAFEIERERCGFDGGKQDQYAAAYGGLNYIIFNGGPDVEVVPLNPSRTFMDRLESESLITFSGQSRSSSKIIREQKDSVLDQKGNKLNSMHALRAEADEAAEAIASESYEALYMAIRRGWDAKRTSSTAVSNPFLEQIISSSMKLGAHCGKVSGAGGGGFVLMFAPEDTHAAIRLALGKYGLTVDNVKITKEGAR